MMKKSGKVQWKMVLVGSICSAIILALTSQLSAAEKKDENRSVYFKVFNGDDFSGSNNAVTVRCDSYDDHLILRDGEPQDIKYTQYDAIIGVSVLCKPWEGHLDPVFHVDGNQVDNWDYTDATDGYLDYFYATASCITADPDYGTGPEIPARVVLQCLDHDAIATTIGK